MRQRPSALYPRIDRLDQFLQIAVGPSLILAQLTVVATDIECRQQGKLDQVRARIRLRQGPHLIVDHARDHYDVVRSVVGGHLEPLAHDFDFNRLLHSKTSPADLPVLLKVEAFEPLQHAVEPTLHFVPFLLELLEARLRFR